MPTPGSLTGQVLSQFTLSWTNPSDPRYGGVDVYYINPGISTTDHYFVGRVAKPGNSLRVSLPAPNSVQSWEFILLAFDVNGNQNSYDPGVTPIVSVSVGVAGGNFDLKNTIPGSIGNGLKVTSSLLDVQTASGGGVGVGASGVNLAGFVNIGSSETFEGVAVVNGGTVAFLGSDGAGHNGIWALAFWAGGSGPANAPAYVDGSGNFHLDATLGGGTITLTGGGSSSVSLTGSGLSIVGGTFTLNSHGITTTLDNVATFGSLLGAAQAFTAKNNSNNTSSVLTENGFYLLDGSSDIICQFQWDESAGVSELVMQPSSAASSTQAQLHTVSGTAFASVISPSHSVLMQADGTHGFVQIDGSQVLTARQTGWTAPAGTLSRASFNPSSVSLVTLAETVAALITDAMTHGWIGA